MQARNATTVIVGILAGLSCLLTGWVIEVPIWVLFIAWASFFAAGGGLEGARKSLTMNLLGVASAVATLLVITALGGSVWAVGLCVVFGAGILVIIGAYDLLSFTPAGFFGFASVVGTVQATGIGVDAPLSFDHPAVLVTTALVLGVVFGYMSEKLAAAVTSREPVTAE